MIRLARLAAQRLLKIVAVILAIAVTNFLLIHAAPGDPASVIAGESGAADPQFMACHFIAEPSGDRTATSSP